MREPPPRRHRILSRLAPPEGRLSGKRVAVVGTVALLAFAVGLYVRRMIG